MTHQFKWKRSRPDARDFRFKAARPDLALPPRADVIRENLPPVLDQKTIGACVAHSVVTCARHGFRVATTRDKSLSRLQLYYDTRVIEGTALEDAGSEIRNAVKVMAGQGVASERRWAYVPTRFAARPPKICYEARNAIRITRYERVAQSLGEMKYALARGYPIAMGAMLYAGFESDRMRGFVQMPQPGEAELGGHAFVAIGYDDTFSAFRCRNSWGKSWGDRGDFWLTELAGDIWAMWVN